MGCGRRALARSSIFHLWKVRRQRVFEPVFVVNRACHTPNPASVCFSLWMEEMRQRHSTCVTASHSVVHKSVHAQLNRHHVRLTCQILTVPHTHGSVTQKSKTKSANKIRIIRSARERFTNACRRIESNGTAPLRSS